MLFRINFIGLIYSLAIEPKFSPKEDDIKLTWDIHFLLVSIFLSYFHNLKGAIVTCSQTVHVIQVKHALLLIYIKIYINYITYKRIKIYLLIVILYYKRNL